MPKIQEKYPIGSFKDLTTEELARMLDQMYTDLAVAINRRIELVERDTDGQASDVFLSNGTVNINTNTNQVEMLTEHDTISTVVWTPIS